MNASPLQLNEVDADVELWQVFGRSKSCAEDVVARRPITDLALSRHVQRRLHRVGIITIGTLLSCSLRSLQFIEQSQPAMAVEIMEQLGVFLGIVIETPQNRIENQEPTPILTADIAHSASSDTIHQFSWSVSLAELCCVDAAELPFEDLNTSVGDVKLDLKVRSRNGLMKSGMQTVADLLESDLTI